MAAGHRAPLGQNAPIVKASSCQVAKGRGGLGGRYPVAGSVVLQLSVEGLAVDAKDAGGHGAIATDLVQDMMDIALLQFGQGEELGGVEGNPSRGRLAGGAP